VVSCDDNDDDNEEDDDDETIDVRNFTLHFFCRNQ
jgi:hypothetical protein